LKKLKEFNLLGAMKKNSLIGKIITFIALSTGAIL
jgi:hypothetical protein